MTPKQKLAVTPEIHRSGFGPAQADCLRCELKNVCLKQGYVEGERPRDWEPGGIMLIGEGPGRMEQALGRPFVGASGRLLDALLEAAGLAREKVWVTNATLGVPPQIDSKNAKAFHERFPQAVYSCLPRLEAEIEAAQPRVIVTLGQAALIALTGVEVQRRRTVKVACANVDCDPETRKLRSLCLVCAMADCDWYQRCAIGADESLGAGVVMESAEEIKRQRGGKCPKCSSSITRLRPRQMKCPTCGGRKTRVEEFVSFEYDWGLVGREGVAGAVLPTETLSSRLDALGVRFVIPTYHPAYCLYPARKGAKVIGGQFAARVVVEHFEKARRLLRSEPVFSAEAYTPVLPSELTTFVSDPSRVYAVDLEWNSEEGPWSPTKITLFGVATVEDPIGMTVDSRHFPVMPNVEPHAWLDAIHTFLADPTKKKIFHNGQADRVVLANLWGMEVQGVVSDTIISHHTLYPDEEQGLAFVAHELLDAPHWKTKKRRLKAGEKDDLGGYGSWDDYALYNARDTRSTALADRVMRGPVGGRGRLDAERVRAAHDLDVRMQEVSIRMELAGLPLDRERVKETQLRAETVCREELLEMRQIVGRGDDWTPIGKNLLWAMYAADGPLKLEPFAYTDTGQPSTAKEALARMSDQHPFVGRLLRYRKYLYTLDHYIHGESLRVQADGRLHPIWKVYGTGTGRWTSNPNFQNWSKGDLRFKDDETLNLRGLVVAPPGRRIVGADYAALELRVMADLSADPGLIQRLLDSDEDDKLNPAKDLHAYIASKAFGNAYLNGTKEAKKILRDIEKRIIYGANYGAGAQTILESIYNAGYEGPPITTGIIDAVLRAIRTEFPGVGVWRDKQVRLANETREVRSPLTGRRRIFPLGDIDITVCFNYGIQSGAADVMNTQLAVLDDCLTSVDPTAVFIAQVHDAIYIECAEDRADDVAKLVSDSLTVELSLGGGPKMLYLASADHSQSWDKA